MPKTRRSRIAKNPKTPKEKGKRGAHIRKVKKGLRRRKR